MGTTEAASRIQFFFRASKSYSMMAHGKQQLNQRGFSFFLSEDNKKGLTDGKEELLEKARGDDQKPRFSSVKAFKKISSENVERLSDLIKDKQGYEQFFQKFNALEFELSHHSNFDAGLEKGISPLKDLLSPRYDKIHKLWEEDKKFNDRQIGNTYREDIEELGDTGFSFFHFSIKNSENARSRLGNFIYKKTVNKKFLEQRAISITYDDRLAKIHNKGARQNGSVYRNGGLFYQKIIEKGMSDIDSEDKKAVLHTIFLKFFDDLKSQLDACVQLHLFMGGDMLSGLASCVFLLGQAFTEKCSQLQEEYPVVKEDLERILLSINSVLSAEDLNQYPEELNALINGWIRPIVRCPGRVFPDHMI